MALPPRSTNPSAHTSLHQKHPTRRVPPALLCTLQVSDKIPAHRNAVALTVTCTDDGQPPLSLTQELQVLIVETADVPKEVRLLGTRVVPENQPPAVVGRIVVVNLLTEDPVASVGHLSLIHI